MTDDTKTDEPANTETDEQRRARFAEMARAFQHEKAARARVEMYIDRVSPARGTYNRRIINGVHSTKGARS